MRRRTYLAGIASTATAMAGCLAASQPAPDTNTQQLGDGLTVGYSEDDPDTMAASVSVRYEDEPPQQTIDLYPDVEEYDTVYRPRPGEVFVILKVQVRHLRGDPIPDAGPLVVLGVDGTEYQPLTFESHDNPLSEELEPTLARKTFRNGSNLTTWLAYSIPRDTERADVTVNQDVLPGRVRSTIQPSSVETFTPPPAE